MVFRCFSHLTEWALGAQGGTAVRMGSASRKSISSTSIVYKHETCSSRLEPSRDREREWKRYFRWLRYTMTHIWVVCGWFVCVCNITGFFYLRARSSDMLTERQVLCIYFVSLNKYIRCQYNERSNEWTKITCVARSSFGTRRTHARVCMYVCCVRSWVCKYKIHSRLFTIYLEFMT